MGSILVLSVLLNLALLAGMSAKGGKSFTVAAKPDRLPEKVIESGSEGRIALIPVRGLIGMNVSGGAGSSMVENAKARLHQAETDPAVKAVVLAVDSPGGEVTASDILYNAVRRVRARKPVVISMGSMATSGGYYLSCGGSYLMASETTFTGSIGVIIQSFRYNDLLNKIGVAPQVFKSGSFKDMLRGAREMTPEEKAYVQNLVMQTYGRFVGIVAKERKLSEEMLRNGIADGRVVTGRDALEARLIDGIGEVEEAIRKARELVNAPHAAVISYEEATPFARLLHYLGSEESSSRVEINLMEHLLPPLEPGRAYLLPSLWVP
jgi:protease-4